MQRALEFLRLMLEYDKRDGNRDGAALRDALQCGTLEQTLVAIHSAHETWAQLPPPIARLIFDYSGRVDLNWDVLYKLARESRDAHRDLSDVLFHLTDLPHLQVMPNVLAA